MLKERILKPKYKEHFRGSVEISDESVNEFILVMIGHPNIQTDEQT